MIFQYENINIANKRYRHDQSCTIQEKRHTSRTKIYVKLSFTLQNKRIKLGVDEEYDKVFQNKS